MNDTTDRSPELEQARQLLRAINPPAGMKQRVERSLLMKQTTSSRRNWRWGLGLAFLAATSTAAATDLLPVRRVIETFLLEHQESTAVEGLTPAKLTTGAGAVASVVHSAEPQREVPAPPATIQAGPKESLRLADRASTPRPARVNHRAEAGPLNPTGAEDSLGERDTRGEHSAPSEPRSDAPASPGKDPSSELAAMVAEYERAKSLTERDPKQALSVFRNLQRKWPNGPLRTEVDLQLVALLNRLGKRDEAQKQVGEFLQEHPDSARAKELEGSLKDRK